MIFELRGATCNSVRVVAREVDRCRLRGRRCCRRRCCSRCRRRRRACVVVVGGIVIDVVSVLAWSKFAFYNMFLIILSYAGQPVTSFVMLSLRLRLVVVAVVVAAAQCAARGERCAASGARRAARGARRAARGVAVVDGVPAGVVNNRRFIICFVIFCFLNVVL